MPATGRYSVNNNMNNDVLNDGLNSFRIIKCIELSQDTGYCTKVKSKLLSSNFK